MLPIYISYFAGGADKKHRILPRALGFVFGFTVVFCLLGLFAGTLGAILTKQRTMVNIVSGALVIIFGLGYLEVIHLPFFKGSGIGKEINSVFSAIIFGMIYSVTLTPCVGVFLSSALMMASYSATALKGVLLLLTYSLGMGIPLLISSVLIDKLGTVFDVIKRNYRVINIICGLFLIVVGIAMMTGFLEGLLNIFS